MYDHHIPWHPTNSTPDSLKPYYFGPDVHPELDTFEEGYAACLREIYTLPGGREAIWHVLRGTRFAEIRRQADRDLRILAADRRRKAATRKDTA